MSVVFPPQPDPQARSQPSLLDRKNPRAVAMMEVVRPLAHHLIDPPDRGDRALMRGRSVELEEELGVMLITRGRNFATLTDAGEVFYEEALEVLARANLAIERVRGEKQKEVLRVGHGPTLTAGIMPGALEHFQATPPRADRAMRFFAERDGRIGERGKTRSVDCTGQGRRRRAGLFVD
ncbi:MAG: hypothetical protein NTV51_04860 [Verrucomicrobia bacterium]|nr:hypothetical protein [Verrucomicrobiota bacterium]